MFGRRSLKPLIVLGVVMIVLVVVLTIGWVLITAFGAASDYESAGLYWALLTIGSVLLAAVLVGVVIYFVLSIKAVNLQRRQSNFVDSVTHELKSPIASLKLYLQTLNRRPVGAEEQADFFRFMLADVERLDELINHVLDAARADHGTVDGEIETVELAALLEESAQIVCQRYDVPAETVSLDLRRATVRTRRGDLEIVFRNLIDNAVKYGGTPPRVVVRLRIDGDGSARIEIVDNGPGIPAKLRRKIFGRFVRLGLELERKKPGTGLGLYIVRTLVQRMHGAVQVADPPHGSGTMFTVTLKNATPVVVSDDDRAGRRGSQRTAPPSAAARRNEASI